MAYDLFKDKEYITKRPLVLSGYAEQQLAYLKLRMPDVPDSVLRQMITEVINENLTDPTIEILRHPSPGNTVRESVPLSTHIKQNIAQNIITPSGSVYCLPTQKESFLKVSLANKIKERKVYKGIMLKAAEEGDSVKEATYNLLQASTKIFVNSAPGAMGSAFNILYDMPGYNSITSTARQSVKFGYAHTERFLEGNLFLETTNDVIAYCIRLKTIEPENVMQVITDYRMYIPTVDDVYDYFMDCLVYYSLTPERDAVRDFVKSLPVSTRTYVFYAGCLKNVMMYNSSFFKTFIQKFFSHDTLTIDETENPENVFKFEGDLMAMITSTNADVLGRDEKGDRYNLETGLKGNPTGVRTVCAIARHMNTMLTRIEPIIRTFLKVESEFSRLGSHENMVRKCVLVSDTDSVIFTTQTLVEWYCGKIEFNADLYRMNAFAVYAISRTVEHGLARLSCGFGMIGNDTTKICMKNEYLYPIMLRTTIKKHYAGIIQIREGKILPKPKDDIKGLQFRSSTLSTDTNDAAKKFLIGTLTEVMEKGKLNARDVLKKVADFEQKIHTSITSGERDYLPMASVNTKENYSGDPYKTSYFYYELWSEVFAGRFDPMTIPVKCFKLPLRKNGMTLASPEYLERLRKFDKNVHDRLVRFLEKWDSKSINQLLIPMTITTIPEIFRPLIDTRGIIKNNCAAFYLGLESMGFAYTYGRYDFLISDFFQTGSQIALPSEV